MKRSPLRRRSKSDKAALRKELDALCREVVMRRAKALLGNTGPCERCGRLTALHWSHIFSRGAYQALRHDPDNAFALCTRCHLYWWHKNPIEAAEWAREKLGVEAFERLKLRAKTARKVDHELVRIKLLQELGRA